MPSLFVFIALVATVVVTAEARGVSVDTGAELRRRVLVLNDATPHEVLMSDEAGALVYEMPLQHLGMLVERRSLFEGPPSSTDLDGLRAVVLHQGSASAVELDLSWLDDWIVDQVLPRGIRLILFNDLGPLAADDARTFAALGLRHTTEWLRDPFLVRYTRDVPRGRAEDDPLYPVYDGLLFDGFRGRSWIRAHKDGSPDVLTVCTGPPDGAFGGLALAPYAARFSETPGAQRWRIDLLEFFREALVLQGVPVVDPVLVNGRRAMFVQVDGDGFESWSTARTGALAAEVFRDTVLEAFHLPFTVSIIVASLTDALKPTECDPRMALATSIFELENVEVATHTVLHPLKWEAPYDPNAPPRTLTWYSGLRGYKYSQVDEVRESVRFIDDYLAPVGKKCDVVLWSGNALPPIETLRVTRELGLLNVNGATCRWDQAFDSISYVLPHVRWIGGELQVYCGAANENVFDGFYDHVPGSFRYIEHTLERTGRGPILKPANIYVHFYGAERPARLEAMLHLIHRFGLEEPTAPIFASQWAEIARDAALGPRLRPNDGGWSIRDTGAARTVRFDDEPRSVDLARSRAVLGFRALHGSLYVHLAGPDADIWLSEQPPEGPYLVEANHVIGSGERGPGHIQWRARSVAQRVAVIGGLRPGTAADVTIGAEQRSSVVAADGTVTLTLPPGDDRIEVRVR